MLEEHICTEQKRMERIETKIDRLIDDVSVIKPIVPDVQRHDNDIRDLQIKAIVTEKMATRKDVIISQIFAIIAVCISAIPYVIKVLTKGA